MTKLFWGKFAAKRAGMALVITLAIIVIATVVVLAFFSQVTATRQIESSRTKQTEADLLSQTACSYVTEEFRQEIFTNSSTNTVGSTTIYTPLSSTNTIPRRSLSAGIALSDPNFVNLIRQSVSGADNNASEDNTALPAKSGRFISTNRWNMPVLLSGGGFNNTNQLACWIYVTGSSGITNAASLNVIGRFSYNVYDIGGLLNINVAGCPSSLTNLISSMKGTLAGADLTQLPGISQADVDSLIAFRNPAATNGDYTNAVTASAAVGFLSSIVTNTESSRIFTNNYFVCRQDLLRYAFTQNMDMTNALPYLTTFSRSDNSPCWIPPASSPGSTYNYFANAESASGTNRDIPNVRFANSGTIIHYKDDGTTTNYSVSAGDPLLKDRFSLAKLVWLTSTGPTTNIADAAIAIQSCFGLYWNNSQSRWDYVGSTTLGSTVVQPGIQTLGQISSENREPNFFELLKAGILNGSLGLAAQQQTMAATGNQNYDSNGDIHILRIGANIIDAANSDNFPRVISLVYSGTVVEVAGQEDLPYLYGCNINSFFQTDTTGANLKTFDVVLAPVFINPYRSYSGSTVSSPGSVTLDIASGSLVSLSVSSGTSSYLNTSKQNLASSTGDSWISPISINQAQFEQFRTGPQPQTNGSASNALSRLIPYVSASVANVQSFRLYSYEYQYTNTWPAPVPSGNPVASINLSNFVLRLRYLAPNGVLKTYYTFGGNEALAASTGINHSLGFGNSIFKGENNIDFSGSYLLACQDPRSGRLGPSVGWTRSDIQSLPSSNALQRYQPYGSPIADGFSSYLSWWPQGGTNWNSVGGYFSNDADPDENPGNLGSSYLRPADDYIGTNANPYLQTSGTDSLNPDSQSRPFILHRPFSSVGELGSVFRDSPWKTISFFHESSGDAALLDLFSFTDEGKITDGRVNLNSLQGVVKQALLSGVGQEPDGSSPLSPSTIQNVVNAYFGASGFAFQGGQPTTNVFLNVSQLAKFLSSSSLSGSGLDAIKFHRESVVRALANSTQERTWNLLIDVVAQAGRFPNGTSSFGAGNFTVEGERRYWLSIAIDRYTGKIVDQQLEAVDE